MSDSQITKSTFVTSHPEEARELIVNAYSAKRVRVTGDSLNFRFEHTRHDLGAVRLDIMHNSLTMEVDMDPIDTVIVARVLDHVLDLDVGDGRQRLGPGDIVVSTRLDRGWLATLTGLRVQTVSIDLPLLRRVAGDAAPDAPRLPSARFGERFPASAALSWQRAVDYVAALSLTETAALSSPLVLDSARRLLVANLLAAVSPEAEHTPTDRTDATPATIRRAIAFIETNADLEIGVAEIAQAAFVTPRAVQLAFRRHLNITPVAYLRRVRLERAHADLRRADPSTGATVTAIAARWGFANSSRFTQHYRALYGDLPSHTLAR